MSNEGQTKEARDAEFAAMNAKMDAAEGIEPVKDEAGEGKETPAVGAEPTGDEAGKSAEPTDGAKSGEEEVDPNIAAAKKGTEPGIQKRFNEMTAKNSALKEELAYLRGKAEAAEAAKGQPTKADELEAEKKEPIKTELNPDDFETLEEYEEAKTVDIAEKVADRRIAEEAQKTQDAEKAKTEATVAEKVVTRTREQGVKAKEKYSDFDEVVTGTNPNLNLLPQETVQMVMDSDVGADLAYQIGKDPELAARLADMTPAQAIREIVALEAPFVKTETTTTKQKTKAVSSAPEPITAPSGGSGGGEIDEDSMPIEDWMKRENARDAKKRHGG